MGFNSPSANVPTLRAAASKKALFTIILAALEQILFPRILFIAPPTLGRSGLNQLLQKEKLFDMDIGPGHKSLFWARKIL